MAGDIQMRAAGSLIAHETGSVSAADGLCRQGTAGVEGAGEHCTAFGHFRLNTLEEGTMRQHPS